MTKEGVISGTPLYMSPEQCAGKNIGTAADVYALGCMLYEMATSLLPFDGASFQLLVKHSFEDPVPPSQRRPGTYVPRALEDLILDMIKKVPETRPTANEVVERLQRISTTLGERERARGRDGLDGRAARMIHTVRPMAGAADDSRSVRPTRPPGRVAPGKVLAVFGVLAPDIAVALRANGLHPVETQGPHLPEGTMAVFAPGQDDAALRHLVSLGVPVITDGAAEDLDHVTTMVALGVADVVMRPVRPEQLATKLERAIKKAARKR
jgi:hypothetical protein